MAAILWEERGRRSLCCSSIIWSEGRGERGREGERGRVREGEGGRKEGEREGG